jgi:multicomponent Na+:H+ antiporter subunit E
MAPFVWNLILAIAWLIVSGNFTEVNFFFGMLVGYGILSVASRQIEGGSTYVRKVPMVMRFIVFFLVDLIKANLRVSYDVITPTHLMRPGVIAFPLDAEDDVEITILGNLISVTPGTLSLDVSSDRKVLYIHAMYLDDEEALRANIKELERRVLELMR